MKAYKIFVAVTLCLLCGIEAFAIGSQSVTIDEGETKTHNPI